MIPIVAQLESAFRSAISAAYGIDADPLIAPSANPQFGDYQSNVAMSLAKAVAEKTGAKTNPRQVAEAVKAKLELGAIASEVSIAGPGFINVRLSPAFLAGVVARTAGDPAALVDRAGGAQTVVVDYSGPNIAKELHVGHLRSTIIGDATCNVLEALGHTVIRQNHVGDWGTQFGMLIAALQEATVSGSPADTQLKDLEAFYVSAKKRFDTDEDFQKRARENVVKLQGGDPAALAAWRTLIDKTREHYLPIYRRLGVKLSVDNERGESFYNPMLADIVKDLRAAGLAVESEGATVVFVDGVDKSPMIIEKSGGGFLYATTDLAAARYRAQQLKADRVIIFTDARQQQHFRQVFTTARNAGWAGHASFEHAPFGAMLGEDGKPFATKKGGTAKLADLLDEAEERALELVSAKSPDLPADQQRAIARAVGVGAVKYADLSKDRISDYLFSFDKMLSMDGNTAPYLQYAHARTRSILRKAEAELGSSANDLPGSVVLESPHEQALVKHLLRLPDTLTAVARELKPHHLCGYLYDLSVRFSGFWENCDVIKSAGDTRATRLLLCRLTGNTLAYGLDLLGIEHPDRM